MEKIWDIAPLIRHHTFEESSIRVIPTTIFKLFPLFLSLAQIASKRSNKPEKWRVSWISLDDWEGSGDSVISVQQTGLNFERLEHCSLSKLVIYML